MSGAPEPTGLSYLADSILTLQDLLERHTEAPALLCPALPQPTVGTHSFRVASPTAQGCPTPGS